MIHNPNLQIIWHEVLTIILPPETLTNPFKYQAQISTPLNPGILQLLQQLHKWFVPQDYIAS